MIGARRLLLLLVSQDLREREKRLMIGDLIAALTWPIDVAQELKEMQDGPAVVTDYASLLRAQQEYKVSRCLCTFEGSKLMKGNAHSNEWTTSITISSDATLPREAQERGEGRTSDLPGTTYHPKSLIGQGRRCIRYYHWSKGRNVKNAGKLSSPLGGNRKLTNSQI